MALCPAFGIDKSGAGSPLPARHFRKEQQMFVRIQALVVALVLTISSAALAAPAAPLETLNVQGLQKLVQANRGKPVVVNFFATWCPPCKAEIPMLVEMCDKYRDKVTFVGITVDNDSTVAKVLPYVAQMQINYPVYRAGNDVVQAFSIRSIPFNVGYGKNGKVAWAFSGFLDEEAFDEMVRELLK